MNNDKEILELAAKAAGIDTSMYKFLAPIEPDEALVWNPLTDDGDALRLAVKLYLDFENDHPECCIVNHNSFPRDYCVVEYYKDYNNDPYAATRCAIVRAAAEIGKDMK